MMPKLHDDEQTTHAGLVPMTLVPMTPVPMVGVGEIDTDVQGYFLPFTYAQ